MKLAIGMMCFLSGSLALAADSWTKGQNPHIEAVRKHFKAGNLERADSELKLARDPKYKNTSVDLGQIAILEGMLAAVDANEEQARAAFRLSLALDPQATLPDEATPYVRKIFAAVRAEPRASSPAAGSARGAGTGRNIPAEFEQKYFAGKLDAAEAFLNAAGAQSNLSQVESGQIDILKGLVTFFQKLQKKEVTPDQCGSFANDLEAAEVRLAEETGLSEAESAQFLAVRGVLLMVGGVLRVEAGDENNARASFRKALEINPRAKLPSVASAKARRLFNEAKAAPAGRKP